MVADRAPSLVARAKPSSCPSLAQRLRRLLRIQRMVWVWMRASESFCGSRLGKPTCRQGKRAPYSKCTSRAMLRKDVNTWLVQSLDSR